MTSSEKHSREDGSSRAAPSLPAVRHSAFAKHWLAVDDGGAELTKAVFGAPARRGPPRPALNETPMPSPSAPLPHGAATPTRLRSTVILMLLVLAILFAVPATNFIGRL